MAKAAKKAASTAPAAADVSAQDQLDQAAMPEGEVSAVTLDEILAKLARGDALDPDEQAIHEAHEAEQAALARGDA